MHLKATFGSWLAVLLVMVCFAQPMARADGGDLAKIKEKGVLRHLGVPYANFITGHGDGLDVELMQRFAKHLGVRYEFVQSNWGTLFADLTGKKVKPTGDTVELLGEADIRGDVIASGLTILQWRRQIINFSTATFPTQVWCIARADFPEKPVVSSGNLQEDIAAVKKLIHGRKIMGKNGTCLAPNLYGIDENSAELVNFAGGLNDLAPALIKGEADILLLDVPDSLVALEKWPGKIKVLGPISPEQLMGVGFRKDAPELLKAFDAFFAELKASGEYRTIVHKYYPAVFAYDKGFFDK